MAAEQHGEGAVNDLVYHLTLEDRLNVPTVLVEDLNPSGNDRDKLKECIRKYFIYPAKQTTLVVVVSI